MIKMVTKWQENEKMEVVWESLQCDLSYLMMEHSLEISYQCHRMCADISVMSLLSHKTVIKDWLFFFKWHPDEDVLEDTITLNSMHSFCDFLTTCFEVLTIDSVLIQY